MKCALLKVQYVGKFEKAFNNHMKDVRNPKSIPDDLHFRKPGHSFNPHAKFTIIEQLRNIRTANSGTLKFRLKRHEDFWIQKLETLTPKGLNQELNNVLIPVNCISCSVFSIFGCSLEMKRNLFINSKDH